MPLRVIGVGATLTPPAQLSLCSRFAALLIKGRDGVCRAAETRFIASPRDRARAMSNISPSTKGGWRAENVHELAGAAPRPASRTPRDDALQVDEVMWN